MSHPLLERHLERQAVKPLYLFYGDEEFLMQRALLRSGGVADGPGRGASQQSGSGRPGGGDCPEFLAESRAATLWGPGQLLILRRVDVYSAAQLKAIIGYLDHPAPRAWVVLLAERSQGPGGGKTRGVGAAGQRRKRPWGFTACGKASCTSG